MHSYLVSVCSPRTYKRSNTAKNLYNLFFPHVAYSTSMPRRGAVCEADSSYTDALPSLPSGERGIGHGFEQSDHGLSQAQAKANNGDWLP